MIASFKMKTENRLDQMTVNESKQNDFWDYPFRSK